MTNESNEGRPYFEVWLEYLRASTGLALTPTSIPSLNWRGSGDGRDGLQWARDPYDRDLLFGENYIRTVLDIPTLSPAPSGMAPLSCDGGQQYGWSFDDGVVLFFKPHDVLYADNRTEGPPLAVLLAETEEYLKGWKAALPKRLATTFYMHKVKRLERMESERIQAAREARRLMESVEIEQQKAMALRRTEMSLLAITEQDFLDSANRWMGMIDNIGALEIRTKEIVLIMHEFAIEGVQLGPYEIILDTENFQPKIVAQRNQSFDGYPHPHVEPSGAICWGGNANVRLFQQVVSQINPVEILFFIANFLKTGYNPPGAYRKLSDWTENRTGQWQCSNCDEYHNDGDNCPRYCSSCENESIDLASHRTCRVHWNCYESDGECGQCAEIRQGQEEERLRLEEEARVAAAAEALEEAQRDAGSFGTIDELEEAMEGLNTEIEAFENECCGCDECISGEAVARERLRVFSEELSTRSDSAPADEASDNPEEGAEQEGEPDEASDDGESPVGMEGEDSLGEGEATEESSDDESAPVTTEQPYGENHPLWSQFSPDDRWLLAPDTSERSIATAIEDLGEVITELDTCADDDCRECAEQAVTARVRLSLHTSALGHFRARPPTVTDEEENTELPT